MKDIIYFEDLEELVKNTAVRESDFCEPLTRKLVEDYVNWSSDDAISHTSRSYNLLYDHKDVFIPGLVISVLAEVLFRKSYPYFVHIIRGFNVKLLRPLYPGDKIKIREFGIELKNQDYLIFENSSPVSCKRKIINQDNEITALFNIDYLIKRRD